MVSVEKQEWLVSTELDHFFKSSLSFSYFYLISLALPSHSVFKMLLPKVMI